MNLLSANDRFEILDLCARYNRALDTNNEEAVMDCWVRSGLSFDGPQGKFTNWDQLKKQLSKDLHEVQGSTQTSLLTSRRSIVFNIVIRDGDTVDSAYVDAEYITIDTAKGHIIETGSFLSDRVTRTSMGWKFLKRSQKKDPLTAGVPGKMAQAGSTTHETHPH